MLNSFIIVLREGFESFLLVAVILAYLRKSGQQWLNTSVYLAIALALAAGTIVATAADARIALNRISLNRISLNRISANRIAFNGMTANAAKADQATANPDAKDAVPAQNKQPGEGSVSAVMSVELPSQ